MCADIVIMHRKRTLVNTDPQRRCYNGAHFSSELRWTEWGVLESMKYLKPGTDPQARLEFWRGLNDYAVAARGEGARTEFKLVDLEDDTPNRGDLRPGAQSS